MGFIKELNQKIKIDYCILVRYIIISLFSTIAYNSFLHIFLIKMSIDKSNVIIPALIIIVISNAMFLYSKRISNHYFGREILAASILSMIISFAFKLPVVGVNFIDKIIVFFITRDSSVQSKLLNKLNDPQYFSYHGFRISYRITFLASLTWFIFSLIYFFVDKSHSKKNIDTL